MEEHHQNWNPSDHVKEFIELLKQFMFEAQGNSNAPVTGAKYVRQVSKELDDASSYQNIWFWSPEQLTIINAIDESWMVMITVTEKLYCAESSCHQSEHCSSQPESIVSVHLY